METFIGPSKKEIDSGDISDETFIAILNLSSRVLHYENSSIRDDWIMPRLATADASSSHSCLPYTCAVQYITSKNLFAAADELYREYEKKTSRKGLLLIEENTKTELHVIRDMMVNPNMEKYYRHQSWIPVKSMMASDGKLPSIEKWTKEITRRVGNGDLTKILVTKVRKLFEPYLNTSHPTVLSIYKVVIESTVNMRPMQHPSILFLYDVNKTPQVSLYPNTRVQIKNVHPVIDGVRVINHFSQGRFIVRDSELNNFISNTSHNKVIYHDDSNMGMAQATILSITDNSRTIYHFKIDKVIPKEFFKNRMDNTQMLYNTINVKNQNDEISTKYPLPIPQHHQVQTTFAESLVSSENDYESVNEVNSIIDNTKESNNYLSNIFKQLDDASIHESTNTQSIVKRNMLCDVMKECNGNLEGFASSMLLLFGINSTLDVLSKNMGSDKLLSCFEDILSKEKPKIIEKIVEPKEIEKDNLKTISYDDSCGLLKYSLDYQIWKLIENNGNWLFINPSFYDKFYTYIEIVRTVISKNPSSRILITCYQYHTINLLHDKFKMNARFSKVKLKASIINNKLTDKDLCDMLISHNVIMTVPAMFLNKLNEDILNFTMFDIYIVDNCEYFINKRYVGNSIFRIYKQNPQQKCKIYAFTNTLSKEDTGIKQLCDNLCVNRANVYSGSIRNR